MSLKSIFYSSRGSVTYFSLSNESCSEIYTGMHIKMFDYVSKNICSCLSNLYSFENDTQSGSLLCRCIQK